MGDMQNRLREEIEKVKAEAVDGVTAAELCDMLSVSNNSIQKIVHRLGITAIARIGNKHTCLYAEEDARRVVREVLSRRRRE